MGDGVFDDFQDLTAAADQIMGCGVKELCLKDPGNLLGKTEFTQPALYTVNALMWLRYSAERNDAPAYLAGHSLGEYNALFAASVFDFETGLKLVKERGRLMAQACGGAMAALVGLEEQKIREILLENSFTTLSVANCNAPLQTVISGPAEDIEKAEPVFKAAGVRHWMVLKVSAAFHSPYMKKASEEFSWFADRFTFKAPLVPVISNATARPYEHDAIAKRLADQIVSPVLWTQTIQFLMEQGVTAFREIGPGNVLTGLLRRIRAENPAAGKAGRASLLANASPKPFAASRKADRIIPENMGSRAFREAYNLKYAYLAGAMFRGIASKDMVIAMGKAGMMGCLGAGGMKMDAIENAILDIRDNLDGKPYGINLLHNFYDPDSEEKLVDLFLKHRVTNVEASAFMQMTPALVRYRLSGLRCKGNGAISADCKIMGKISRPEVAKAFLSPAPERIVQKLLEQGRVTREQAALSQNIPMADSLCAEADSGGHTDGASAYALFPAIRKLRDDMVEEYGYETPVFVGAAGGIGTPESAAAAFVLGADFILTGSINQCSVEAGTSELVKDMLQEMNVQDTDYAPAGDMFETGAKVQVLKKGVLFPARAKRLFDIYQHCDSLDAIDPKTRKQVRENYFKCSFEDVWDETKQYFKIRDPEQIRKAETNPKHKMALVFRWYMAKSVRMANRGVADEKVNFQIHTGPALGAFNQWVKGTELENWRNRHVDDIGNRIMEGSATLLGKYFKIFSTVPLSSP